MIDLHTHILPGVDDGASSLEESLVMAKMAVKSGVTALVATSHGCGRKNTVQQYWNAYHQLKLALKEEQIPLDIISGNEIFLTEDALESIKKEELLSINQTRYLLVEFDFEEEAWVAEYYLQILKEAGYSPIIAHPERYRFMQRSPELSYEWVQQDYVLQVNKDSILGRFGSRCQRLAIELLHHNLVQIVASDAHGAERRTTRMDGIQALLQNEFSFTCAELLLRKNPRRIVQGEEVVTFPPRPFYL